MPNEAPYGHGCPPESFAGKASKFQEYGPESAKQGRGCPPGDKVPKQGNKTLAAAKEAPPRQWLLLNSQKLLRFLGMLKLLTRPLTHHSPPLKNNKLISKFFRKVEVLFNKNNRHITAITQ